MFISAYGCQGEKYRTLVFNEPFQKVYDSAIALNRLLDKLPTRAFTGYMYEDSTLSVFSGGVIYHISYKTIDTVKILSAYSDVEKEKLFL